MNSKVKSYIGFFAFLGVAAAPAAHAQWAVVDAPAIVQLIQQVQTMAAQLETARNQLTAARQSLQAMTGGRGMEALLSGTLRNYLPSDWAQFNAVLAGGGTYSGLNQQVQSALTATAVLSPQQLAALPLSAQQMIQARRQWNALRQAVSHAALANASARFDSLQSLISTIGSASDQKAALDLQARISAELGMLQNEQTKLQLFAQSAGAQDLSLEQQVRERVVDGHGRFGARFQPVP
jgi:type IV secretion system protein VirB5